MRCRLVLATGAHPRSRGEHRALPSDSSTSMGSSPLTRGALRNTPLPQGDVGLIPAHAGST